MQKLPKKLIRELLISGKTFKLIHEKTIDGEPYSDIYEFRYVGAGCAYLVSISDYANCCRGIMPKNEAVNQIYAQIDFCTSYTIDDNKF